MNENCVTTWISILNRYQIRWSLTTGLPLRSVSLKVHLKASVSDVWAQYIDQWAQ